MQKALQKDPTDTRALYYLGVHAHDSGRYEEALERYRNYLDHSDHPEERYKVMWQMGRCLYLLGRWDEAREVFFQGISERYDLAECYVSLGELAMENEAWDEAEHYFKLACDRKLPLSGVFFSEDFYSWLPYHKLCEVYDRTENFFGAIHSAQQLLGFESVPADKKRAVEERVQYWYIRLLDEKRGKAEELIARLTNTEGGVDNDKLQ